MSIEKTGSRTDDLLSRPDLTGPDLPGSDSETRHPETPRPRFRHAIKAGASRVREAAPAQARAAGVRARQAGGTVRQNPAPTAGVLALIGGAITALVLRRRAARAKAAPARRWVPARFQR